MGAIVYYSRALTIELSDIDTSNEITTIKGQRLESRL